MFRGCAQATQATSISRPDEYDWEYLSQVLCFSPDGTSTEQVGVPVGFDCEEQRFQIVSTTLCYQWVVTPCVFSQLIFRHIYPAYSLLLNSYQ